MQTPKVSIELPYPIKLEIVEPKDQLITWQEALMRVVNGLPVEVLKNGMWSTLTKHSHISLNTLTTYVLTQFRIPPTTVILNIA